MHKHLAGLLLLAATTAGCTVKPGEYRVYRLATNTLVSQCQSDAAPDTRHTGSENGFGEMLIAVYASDGDTYFLEDGGKTILGERSKNSYTFRYNETRNDTWGMPEGLPVMFNSSQTTDELWDLEIKGKGLSGSLTITTTTTCSGSEDNCNAVQFPPDICTFSQEVFGTEVDDIDIEYVLDSGLGGDGGGADG